jgi:hypothetical protein
MNTERWYSVGSYSIPIYLAFAATISASPAAAILTCLAGIAVGVLVGRDLYRSRAK